MLGFNAVAMAKAEVLKLDENHNGKPDAIEALDALEASIEKISKLSAFITPAKIDAFFAFLPPALTSDIPPVLLTEAKAELAALPGQLIAAETALKKVEAALQSK